MSGPVTVRGGSDSIAADFEQLAAFASALDRAAGPVGGALRVLGRCLADPAMAPAAVLDPVGGAHILALTGVAMAGTASVLAGCQAAATGLRLAAAAYRAADELDRRLAPMLTAASRLPLALAPLAGPVGLVPGTPFPAGPFPVSPFPAGPFPVSPFPAGPFPVSPSLAGAQAGLTADPALAGAAVRLLAAGAGGGLPLPGGVTRMAGLLATAFPDGAAEVSAQPAMPTADRGGPPRGAADLIRALALRAAHNDGGGAVDVRILDGPSGRRVILNITGTTVWNLDPTRRSAQVSDFGTNLRALANQSSVFERGAVEALRRAGVKPGEPVMLVGHSQGGMIAAQLAGRLQAGSEFTVTHLVTVGAPVGLAPVPRSVSVLSLQNQGDVVPELDGADNPRRGGWITAQTAHGDASLVGRHSLQAYLAGAVDLDGCSDPALAQWRRTAAGFLDAEQVATQVFQIRRAG